ncbi:MAG: alcohol dehydrogenase catalytic domain-containing protein [Solirubrobacteraceae bacterium]
MRAVVYEGFREAPTVVSVPDPDPAPHGAVVRVEASGLCRSDWHGWMGHDPDINRFPHVPGHELAGVVEAVGADVQRWGPGQRVTVPFVCACGTCEQCAAGNGQICDRQTQPGFTHWGSFAELVALDRADVNLVGLPDAVEAGAAAGLGCRFATAYRAVLQVGRAQPGEWVAVHGCGGVGLSAVMIAAAAGARVVALDVSQAAVDAARAAGAAIAAAAGADVRELTGGGAHVSLDAIGAEDACAASVAGLRKRGRHVQVGLLPEPPRVPMDLVISRELELLGSHGMAASAYPEMLALVEAGRLRPGDLVTREIGLDDVPAALAAMGEPARAGVTIIRP